MSNRSFYKELFLEVLDEDIVHMFANSFAKKVLYIPKHIYDGHMLSQYGEATKTFLERRFRGKVIYIPKMDKDKFKNLVEKSNGGIRYSLRKLVIRFNNIRNSR